LSESWAREHHLQVSMCCWISLLREGKKRIKKEYKNKDAKNKRWVVPLLRTPAVLPEKRIKKIGAQEHHLLAHGRDEIKVYIRLHYVRRKGSLSIHPFLITLRIMQ
jgi:hypothetical protein